MFPSDRVSVCQGAKLQAEDWLSWKGPIFLIVLVCDCEGC